MVCDNCELVAYLVLSDDRKVQRGKKANAKVKHRGLWGSRGGTDGSRIRLRLLFSCIDLFSCSLSFRSLYRNFTNITSSFQFSTLKVESALCHVTL